jgi:hypothetical protein
MLEQAFRSKGVKKLRKPPPTTEKTDIPTITQSTGATGRWPDWVTSKEVAFATGCGGTALAALTLYWMLHDPGGVTVASNATQSVFDLPVTVACSALSAAETAVTLPFTVAEKAITLPFKIAKTAITVPFTVAKTAVTVPYTAAKTAAAAASGIARTAYVLGSTAYGLGSTAYGIGSTAYGIGSTAYRLGSRACTACSWSGG